MRILLAEDEEDLNNVIVKKLKLEGYSVEAVFNGLDALEYIRETDYDAVILDIMMPKMSGIEVVEKLRKGKNNVPILFLTAKDSIEDRVFDLDIGADDYLVKPFAFDELTARIRVMTRKKTRDVTNVFYADNLTCDCNTHIVKRGNKEIVLSAKEFALLEYMIRNKGIVLTREKIESHVWSYEYEGASNLVDVYIRYLRKKIDTDFDKKLIHTIRGIGYVLREESWKE